MINASTAKNIETAINAFLPLCRDAGNLRELLFDTALRGVSAISTDLESVHGWQERSGSTASTRGVGFVTVSLVCQLDMSPLSGLSSGDLEPCNKAEK